MNVKKLLEDKNIDPKDFARAVDVSDAHVYNLVQGKYAPSLKLMKKIREVYKLPLGDIWVIKLI